ncbi:Plasmodium exported protein, unknown function [Plasmodium vivax]|uniref:Uncharacterized protein n=1 Tax=Plasmodium vivax TaxID=5855 RepID=A0A1G4GZ91_PLAVI|nr:Plasmodium exported protein, unknown function [Plasmodium vivax]
MFSRLIKSFIFILITYILLYSQHSIFANHLERRQKQDVIVDFAPKTTTLEKINTEKKALLSKQVEESQKIKEYFFDNNDDTNNLNLKDIQDVLFGDDVSRECTINLLKQMVLQKPKAAGKKLKKLENAVTGSGQITEAKLKAVKNALLEKGSKKAENGQRKAENGQKKGENSLKSLKDNMLNNPFVKEIMLNELEDILLGSELKNEYILKVLNKKRLSNTISELTMLKELEDIIVRNKLVNESKVAELRKILLSDEPITNEQMDKLKTLLSVLLCDNSYLKSKLSESKGNYLSKTSENNKSILLKKNDLVSGIETKKKNVSSNKKDSTKKDGAITLTMESIQKVDTTNKVNVKKIHEGGQKINAAKKSGLKGESNLLKTLESMKKKEETARSEMLKKNTIINKIDAQKMNEVGQKIDALNKAGVKFESGLFKLYESIKRDAEAGKTKVPGKVDASKKAGLSRDSGLYKLYESIKKEEAVKEEELQLNEFSKIIDVTGKDESTKNGYSPKKDVLAPEHNLWEIDESMRKDAKETIKGATLPKVKSAKKIDIAENFESLEKLDSVKKYEAAAKTEVLQEVPSAAKRGAMYKTKPSGRNDSLKRVDAISKENLSPKDSSLSSVEISPKKKSWRKDDAFTRDKFSEKDDSLSSLDIITKKKVWGKVNTKSPADESTRKKSMGKDDSTSTVYSVPKRRLFKKNSFASKIRATIKEKISRKYDSSSADDYKSSDYSTRKRDVSSWEDSETADSSFAREDAYRKYYSPEKDSSVEEVYTKKKKGNLHNRLKSVRKSFSSSHNYGESNDDSLDDIRKSTNTPKEDYSENHIYLGSENNMHTSLNAEKSTYTPWEKYEETTYDYTFDTESGDKYPEEDSSMGEIHMTRGSERNKRMKSVKQSYMSKTKQSEVEIDSEDDAGSEGNLYREEYPMRDFGETRDGDFSEESLYMNKGETLVEDAHFKERDTLYQPALEVEDNFSEKIDIFDQPNLELENSSVKTSGKKGLKKLFGKDGLVKTSGKKGLKKLFGKDGLVKTSGKQGLKKLFGKDSLEKTIDKLGIHKLFRKDSYVETSDTLGQQKLYGKDSYVETSDTLGQQKLYGKDSYVKTSDTLGQQKLYGKDSYVMTSGTLGQQKLSTEELSAILINILKRRRLMKNKRLKNKAYLACAKNLYRKMKYINECGYLNNYTLPPKRENENKNKYENENKNENKNENENENDVYITEDDNGLFKKINAINSDDYIPDEPKSTIVDEYEDKLYLTYENRLFKKIHSEKKSDLENVKELLQKKETQKAEEFVKKEILPKEKKCVIYIYMDDKKKDTDPEAKEKDWIIYKHVKDGKIKVELLKDVETMTKVDVAAVDSVYRQTEETLMKNIIEPSKEATKPNVKEVIKNVAKYGIPGTLAATAIPFLAMKHLQVAGTSLLLEAGLAGLSAGVATMASSAPEVAALAGSCAVETASSFLGGGFNLGGLLSSFSTGATCAANLAVKTASVTAKAVVDATAAATSAGATHVMIQFTFPILIALAVVIIVEVLFQIFLYLDNKGSLDFIDKYKRRFKRFMVERKYKMSKPNYLYRRYGR